MSTLLRRLERLGLRPLDSSAAATPEAYIGRLERRVGQLLPVDYRAFLRTFGVCAFADYVCFGLPDSALVDVSVFFGADVDEQHDLDHAWQRRGRKLTAPLLPIAADPFANSICLDLGPHSFGQVRFWRRPQRRACFVATSFAAFVHLLRRDS